MSEAKTLATAIATRLTDVCPSWRNRYSNVHEAVRGVQDSHCTELYAQWLGTEAGVRFLATQAKWTARAQRQAAAREKSLNAEYGGDDSSRLAAEHLRFLYDDHMQYLRDGTDPDDNDVRYAPTVWS